MSPIHSIRAGGNLFVDLSLPADSPGAVGSAQGEAPKDIFLAAEPPKEVRIVSPSLEEFHRSLKGAHANGNRVVVHWGCGKKTDELTRTALANPDVLIAGIDPDFRENRPGFLPPNLIFFRGTGRKALKNLVGEGVIDMIRVIAPGYTDQAWKRAVQRHLSSIPDITPQTYRRSVTLSERDMVLCHDLFPEGGVLEIFTENPNWISDFRVSLGRTFGPQNIEASEMDISQAPSSKFFQHGKVHNIRAKKASGTLLPHTRTKTHSPTSVSPIWVGGASMVEEGLSSVLALTGE